MKSVPTTCDAHGVEFVPPPGPQVTFDGIAFGATLPDARGTEVDRDSVKVLGRRALRPAPAEADEAGFGQSSEDPRRLRDRPALQLRALDRVSGFAEPPVQTARCEAQAAPAGEGVVGAGAKSVGVVADERGAQRGAGAGWARVRL